MEAASPIRPPATSSRLPERRTVASTGAGRASPGSATLCGWKCTQVSGRRGRGPQRRGRSLTGGRGGESLGGAGDDATGAGTRPRGSVASAVPGPLLEPPSGHRRGRRPAPGLRARSRERRSRRARPTRAGLCQGQGVMPRLGDGHRVNERTCPRRPASSSLPGARSPEPAPRCHRCHTPAHTSTRRLSPRMRTVWPGAQPRACAGPARPPPPRRPPLRGRARWLRAASGPALL